jgi:MYXO-CTERM domain-containing protein
VQDGTTWTQQAELAASDGQQGDSFGTSVALSGGTVIVGAPSHAVGNNGWQGAAYVFVQSGTSWTQQAELTASDGAGFDQFGCSVGVSGSTAIVGAWDHEVANNCEQGAAYVFTRSGASWTQQAELIASDGAALDTFGSSVALSGCLAVVAAPEHRVGVSTYQGAAYVFVQSGSARTQQVELAGGIGAEQGFFGWSVSLSGGTAIVGASGPPHLDPWQDTAYVFVQNATAWTQQAELTVSNSGDERFGFSVSGSTVLVGAPGRGGGDDSLPGTAFAYEPEPCDAGPRPPVADAGAEAGATADSGKPLDARSDSRVSHDAARDAGTTRDAPSPTDSAGQDSGHDASPAPDATDASWRAHAGLHVSGPVGCGCRVARTDETRASPWWLALGITGLAGRRRSRRKTRTRSR